MTAHTPGPYIVREDRATHENPTGKHFHFWKCPVFSGQALVAYGRGPTREIAVANARLIAAAPELLDALKKCEKQLDECQRFIRAQGLQMTADHLDLSLAPARAAIARTEGKA